MTYPVKFRQHMLSVGQTQGVNDRELAQRFGIGLSSLKRWQKKPEPVKTRNLGTKIDMQALADDVAWHPEDYQYERAKP